MVEAATVIGFVVLSLASAWALYKTIYTLAVAKTKTDFTIALAYFLPGIILIMSVLILMFSLP